MNPNTVEIPSLLKNKTTRQFVFDDEGFSIEKPLSYDLPEFIASEDISAFRYGVKFVKGYSFVIGRQFFIEIKDYQNKVTTIKLKSYYGIRRKTYHELWSNIFNKLWEHYFSNVYNYYIELYNLQQAFELAGIKFFETGISWDKNNSLNWQDVALSNYRTYFMIYNNKNPKQHKSINFANDWNAFILQCLLKSIINQPNRISNTSV